MEKIKDGSEYGIDLNSSKVQNMSEAMTTHDVLQETVYGWLKGTTMFYSATEMKNLTYADFVEHIGCDANEFYFDNKYDSRVYTWNASDRQYARFMVHFRKNLEDKWVVYATGASQIEMPDSYLEYLKNR